MANNKTNVEKVVGEIESNPKSWVRNPNPINMSVQTSDPEKIAKTATIFNKLMELRSRRGIAKFDSTDEMETIIEKYFMDCADVVMRPTIRGLASALGTNYNTLLDWEGGSRDATLGSSCSGMVKKAKQFIAEFDEVMALEGVDNPILYMFRSKNYYGMSDKQEIVINQGQHSIADETPTEIAARIASDLPE